MVHTCHTIIYGDVCFVALLETSWDWGESKSTQTCLVINRTDWHQKRSKKFICCRVSPYNGERRRRKCKFLALLVPYVVCWCNCRSTRCKITHITRWWRLEVLKVYRFQDIFVFVLICNTWAIPTYRVYRHYDNMFVTLSRLGMSMKCTMR